MRNYSLQWQKHIITSSYKLLEFIKWWKNDMVMTMCLIILLLENWYLDQGQTSRKPPCWFSHTWHNLIILIGLLLKCTRTWTCCFLFLGPNSTLNLLIRFCKFVLKSWVASTIATPSCQWSCLLSYGYRTIISPPMKSVVVSNLYLLYKLHVCVCEKKGERCTIFHIHKMNEPAFILASYQYK